MRTGFFGLGADAAAGRGTGKSGTGAPDPSLSDSGEDGNRADREGLFVQSVFRAAGISDGDAGQGSSADETDLYRLKA